MALIAKIILFRFYAFRRFLRFQSWYTGVMKYDEKTFTAQKHLLLQMSVVDAKHRACVEKPGNK